MKYTTRKTKIIATIGPSTRNAVMIKKLIKAGVNVFRLNFSHGKHDSHRESVRLIRETANKLNTPVGILADLQGPKIRTGNTLNDQTIRLKTGSKVVLTSKPVVCDASVISIDYLTLSKEIVPGQIIVINDGAIRLQVKHIDVEGDQILCSVTSGGSYSSRKGVNLPNVHLKIPSMTRKDIKDLDFILSLEVQYIALSFVRSASDIKALRKLTEKLRPEIKLIAKIEKPEAALAADEILEAADGIMVARGDLGVEATPFDVPILQKNLICKAEAIRKPVIVATQMLESMIENALPTRAESTDVANAIFDGADAVMLSGETAVGANPEKAVLTMAQIAETAEQSVYMKNNLIRNKFTDIKKEKVSFRAVCESAAWASAELNNIPICVFTLSGDTALYLSKIRTVAPIYAFSPDEAVVNMLSLAYNIQAFKIKFGEHIADLVEDAEKLLIEKKLVKRNNRIVLISGTAPVRGGANFMQIKRL